MLNKPTALTDEEYGIMKTHAALTAILKSVLAGISAENSGYLDMAVDMATYHHERWSDQSYSEGTASEIRHRQMPGYHALEIGKAFDPILLEVFPGLEDEVRKAALAANTAD